MRTDRVAGQPHAASARARRRPAVRPRATTTCSSPSSARGCCRPRCRSCRQADDLLVLARGEELAIRFAATPWVPGRFARELATAVERDRPRRGRRRGGVVAAAAPDDRTARSTSRSSTCRSTASDIATMPIARYRFHLAVAADDPLAGRAVIAAADLTGRRVLLLPERDAPARDDAHAHVVREPRRRVDRRDVAGRRAVARGPAAPRAGGHRSPPRPRVADPARGRGDRCRSSENPVEFELGIAWRCRDPCARAPRATSRPACGRREGDRRDDRATLHVLKHGVGIEVEIYGLRTG